MNDFALSAIGGVLIGLSAVLLMGTLGRITGISGIASSLMVNRPADYTWRVAFVAGLIVAPLLVRVMTGESGIGDPVVPWPWMLAAGLLVGIGTKLGSGCTSGHGVCGIARLSRRSLAATAVFMVFGIATVFVVRHVWGGSP